MNEAQAAALKIGSLMGRLGAPERFSTLPLTMAAPYQDDVAQNLNIDRPVAEMCISFEGELTISGANFATVAAEGIPNLLQRVWLNGQHAPTGSTLTPLDASGATLWNWTWMFGGGFGSFCQVNGQMLRPGFDAVGEYSSGFRPDVGVYKIFCLWRIPFAPMLGPFGNRPALDAIPWMLYPRDWRSSLQLQLQWGDASALGDTTGAAVSWAGYDGTGSPRRGIWLTYGMLGDDVNLRNEIRSGVVIRAEKNFQSLVSAGANQYVTDLQHRPTTNVLVKTGTSLSNLSIGVQAYGTLSDRQFETTVIKRENTNIRNTGNNLVAKYGYVMPAWGAASPPPGYFLFTFDEAKSPITAYDPVAAGLPPSAQLAIWTDVLTSGATQRQALVQEMLVQGPYLFQ